MTAYTPGPWRAITCNYQLTDTSSVKASWLILGKDDLRSVVQVWGNDDKDEANAYLIAAAPDLLEALQAMLDVCYDIELDDETVNAVTMGVAAIEKATGGNNE